MNPLRIQLWSYNYDPEPTGIAPLSRVWVHAMRERGHAVDVIAAHPHYPQAMWGKRLRPYREVREGVPLVRLPLWIGRRTGIERMCQEASFAAALGLASPFLAPADVIVAVSPSFPALAPAMLHARRRRTPWILWLQDILPDGATATGIVRDGAIVKASRALEIRAYNAASRVVVLSKSFSDNLLSKGVMPDKIVRVYNPASREVERRPRPVGAGEAGHVMTMGNVGHSQGLIEFARAFEREPGLTERGAQFTIAGDGLAGDAVRAAITTRRVRVTGILDSRRLSTEIDRARIAVVSQRHGGTEFNVPSKLANFMGAGLPVVASVDLGGEVARIVHESGCGWVTDSSRPQECARRLAEALGDETELARRGAAGLRFAQKHFTPKTTATRFEDILRTAIGQEVGRRRGGRFDRGASDQRALRAIAEPAL